MLPPIKCITLYLPRFSNCVSTALLHSCGGVIEMLTNVVITDASARDTLSTLEEKLPQSSPLDRWPFPQMQDEAENHPSAPCQPEETQKDHIYCFICIYFPTYITEIFLATVLLQGWRSYCIEAFEHANVNQSRVSHSSAVMKPGTWVH